MATIEADDDDDDAIVDVNTAEQFLIFRFLSNRSSPSMYHCL